MQQNHGRQHCRGPRGRLLRTALATLRLAEGEAAEEWRVVLIARITSLVNRIIAKGVVKQGCRNFAAGFRVSCALQNQVSIVIFQPDVSQCIACLAFALAFSPGAYCLFAVRGRVSIALGPCPTALQAYGCLRLRLRRVPAMGRHWATAQLQPVGTSLGSPWACC